MTRKADSRKQAQFLDVVSRDEAVRRFHRHLRLEPLEAESVTLSQSLHRVLAHDVVAEVDVTSFDRSNVDGFAVQSHDTVGAMEEKPRSLTLRNATIVPGIPPTETVESGVAIAIATGGMVPRGADAIVMVEDTDVESAASESDSATLLVRRSVAAGESISFAATDLACGETVLRRRQLITSRELGVLAAIGRTHVDVIRKPRIAIISTGNEIVPPGEVLTPGKVYDSNAANPERGGRRMRWRSRAARCGQR